MRVLLDTNILIYLEDSANGVLDESLQSILKISSKNNIHLYHHPKSLDDIQNDPNEQRKISILSRLKKYHLLEESITKPSDEYYTLVGETRDSKGNDKIDNHILYSVFNNEVSFLITEDKGIHKKAKTLNISSKVFFFQQFHQFLIKQYPEEREISDRDIENKFLHEISKDEQIYLSIKKDYEEFDSWYEKAARDGRKAWTYSDSKGLRAICIYKSEDNPIVTDEHKALPGKTLKLSTFKVSEHFFGRKIGEALLRLALIHAVTNNFDYVYLEVRKNKHDYFENFLLTFGFQEFGTTRKGEDIIYCKRLSVSQSSIYNYPCINQNSNYKSFLIPIKPIFHRILLGSCEKQISLLEPDIAPARQAIRKAYLCHSRTSKMSPGDLVFFYKTGEQSITSFGILESVFDSDDEDEVIELVAKRTIYSRSDITTMCSKRVKVLLFLFVDCSDKPVNLHTLLRKKLINGRLNQ